MLCTLALYSILSIEGHKVRIDLGGTQDFPGWGVYFIYVWLKCKYIVSICRHRIFCRTATTCKIIYRTTNNALQVSQSIISYHSLGRFLGYATCSIAHAFLKFSVSQPKHDIHRHFHGAYCKITLDASKLIIVHRQIILYCIS